MDGTLPLFPHITVWGSCFSLGSRRGSAPLLRLRLRLRLRLLRLLRLLRSLTHSLSLSLSLSLTHSHARTHARTHSRTHARTHSLTHHITYHISLNSSSHLTHHLSHLTHHSPLTTSRFSHPPSRAAARVVAAGAAAVFCVAGAVHRAAWQAQYTEPPSRWGRGCLLRGRRSTQSLQVELRRAWSPLDRGCLLRGRHSTQGLQVELRRAWSPLGPRLSFAWQAQYIHRASKWSCGARGRRWGRGCLLRGRRNTHSLQVELRRGWSPLGPRLPLAWQAQYTEPPSRAAARVVAAGAAAVFCVAGAVHRASKSSCGARGCRCGFAWQAQYTETPSGCAAASRVAGAIHIASKSSCGARGRRCGRGGRRSTQSLQVELRRAWLSLGPQLPFAWQAQCTEPPSGAAARVVAAGAAVAFCVAAAVHRASKSSCGARGRR